METILTMAKMLTNERREFEFIRKNSKNIFFVVHRQKRQVERHALLRTVLPTDKKHGLSFPLGISSPESASRPAEVECCKAS